MSAAPVDTRTPRSLSTLRVTGLIVAFAARRAFNRIAATLGKNWTKGARSGTARKRSVTSVVLAAFSALFLFYGVTFSTRIVNHVAQLAERAEDPNVEVVHPLTFETIEASSRKTLNRESLKHLLEIDAQYLERSNPDVDYREHAHRLLRHYEERGAAGFRATRFDSFTAFPESDLWVSAHDSRHMLIPLGLITVLFVLSLSLLSIGGTNQDLSKADWSFEWWLPFPVPARALFTARALETATANPQLWLFLFPFFSVVFWCRGWSWLGVALAAVSTAYVGVIAGSLRVIAEPMLRRYFTLRAIGRLQAVFSLVGTLLQLVAVAAISPTWLERLIAFSRGAPEWVWINPLLPVSMAMGGIQGFVAGFGCLVFGCTALFGATSIGSWLIRDGLTIRGTEGRRGQKSHRIAKPVEIGFSSSREPQAPKLLFGSVARKELLSVLRNRQRLLQIFILPFVVLGMFTMNRSTVGSSPLGIAGTTFWITALNLGGAACNTLAADAPALWIYYAAPQSLERILIQKTAFWSTLASLMALVIFACLNVSHAHPIWTGAPLLALVLLGIGLNASIAVMIGALGTDPFETDARRRLQPTTIYLYMLLAGMFGYALYTPSLWAKFAQLVLSTLLVAALWQKVRDHAPFLLDPNAAPPPSIAVADGVIVALAFFVLQGLLILNFKDHYSPGASLLFAFAGAGVIVGVLTLLIFWRLRVPALRATLGLRLPKQGVVQGVAAGIGSGLACGVVAQGYLWGVAHIDVLRRVRDETVWLSQKDTTGDAVIWLAVLAIVAAPIFEEFIFRGVLYGGFRRSFGPLRAAAAAAIVFAIIHPAIATPPVFLLGLCCALLHERFGSLLTPIAAHMTYNATVMGVAFFERLQ